MRPPAPMPSILFRPGLTLALVLSLAGCTPLGKVSQGRVIRFDAARGLVTCIEDSNPMDPANPRYDTLPPVTVRIPTDPRAMGPVPEAGRLLSIDTSRRKLVFFDAGSGRLQSIGFQPLRVLNGVFPNDSRVSGVDFPRIDPAQKTITVYERRLRRLVTFAVGDEYWPLPAETWKLGDEIRYYYKTPGQALRMMNVTRTEIS